MARLQVLWAVAATGAGQTEAEIVGAITTCSSQCPWVIQNFGVLAPLTDIGRALDGGSGILTDEQFDLAVGLCAGCASFDGTRCGILQCACDGTDALRPTEPPTLDRYTACSPATNLLSSLGIVCKALTDNDMSALKTAVDDAANRNTCTELATTLGGKAKADEVVKQAEARRDMFTVGPGFEPLEVFATNQADLNAFTKEVGLTVLQIRDQLKDTLDFDLTKLPAGTTVPLGALRQMLDRVKMARAQPANCTSSLTADALKAIVKIHADDAAAAKRDALITEGSPPLMEVTNIGTLAKLTAEETKSYAAYICAVGAFPSLAAVTGILVALVVRF